MLWAVGWVLQGLFIEEDDDAPDHAERKEVAA
jgi:hypothetical protein